MIRTCSSSSPDEIPTSRILLSVLISMSRVRVGADQETPDSVPAKIALRVGGILHPERGCSEFSLLQFLTRPDAPGNIVRDANSCSRNRSRAFSSFL